MASSERVFEASFDSCVRGFHVYQDIWMPVPGEILPCTHELANAHNFFVVKAKKEVLYDMGLRRLAWPVCCLLKMVVSYYLKLLVLTEGTQEIWPQNTLVSRY